VTLKEKVELHCEQTVQDGNLLWKVTEKWGETLPVALFSQWLFEMNRRARFESEWDITIVGIGFECNRLP
jgi:hypothetical protein